MVKHFVVFLLFFPLFQSLGAQEFENYICLSRDSKPNLPLPELSLTREGNRFDLSYRIVEGGSGAIATATLMHPTPRDRHGYIYYSGPVQGDHSRSVSMGFPIEFLNHTPTNNQPGRSTYSVAVAFYPTKIAEKRHYLSYSCELNFVGHTPSRKN